MTNIIFSPKIISLIELMEKLLQAEIDGACECWEAASLFSLACDKEAVDLNISKGDMLQFSKQLKEINLKFDVHESIEDQWDEYNRLVAYKDNLKSSDEEVLNHAINTIVNFKKNLNKEQRETLKSLVCNKVSESIKRITLYYACIDKEPLIYYFNVYHLPILEKDVEELIEFIKFNNIGFDVKAPINSQIQAFNRLKEYL